MTQVQKPNRHFQPVSRGSELAASSRITSRYPDAHVQFARPAHGPLQAGMAASDAGDAPVASTLPSRCTAVHAAEILLQSHPDGGDADLCPQSQLHETCQGLCTGLQSFEDSQTQ